MPTHEDGFARARFSVATRQLLCVLAAGDVGRHLPHVAADWDEVFDGVCRHGLVGLTYAYLKQHPSPDYPPTTFRQQVRHAYLRTAVASALMYRTIDGVLSRLRRAGIDCLVVKGPAVAYTAYPDPLLRSFSDLDIVVRERDWAVIHQLLLREGFEPERDLPQPPPKLIPQLLPYEFKYWHPERRLLVEVHYDDLLNAGLASRDIEGFWQRARMIDIGDLSIKVLSLEDQLIHLCAHVHYHGYTRLIWLSDIALIIRDHAADLDWDCIIGTVRTEEAQIPVYYTLQFLERLLGIAAPRDVVAALRPDRWRRRLHEYYLPEAKVLSLQPMPRPDFSFYWLPLFKRLLPDLLVMGRRREKMHCLLRLLLPPRAWLRFYYHLDGRGSLARHYLLHPLKLLCHYLFEVVVVVWYLCWRILGKTLRSDTAWWEISGLAPTHSVESNVAVTSRRSSSSSQPLPSASAQQH